METAGRPRPRGAHGCSRRFVGSSSRPWPISAWIGVSEVTIRNDLDTLAEDGRLRRVRGGAVHRTTSSLEAPYEQALDSLVAEKLSIARAASVLVESGQTG